MGAVQYQFYALAAGCPVQTGHHRRHFHRHEITHEGAVHEVGEEHPTLVFGKAQDGGALFQLHQIGFLGPGPGGVSPAADAAGNGLQAGQAARSCDGQRGWDPGGLGEDAAAVFRVHEDSGKAGSYAAFRFGFRPEGDSGRPHVSAPGKGDGDAGSALIGSSQAEVFHYGHIRASFRKGPHFFQGILRRLLSAREEQPHLAAGAADGVVENEVGMVYPEGNLGAAAFRKLHGIDPGHDGTQHGRFLLLLGAGKQKQERQERQPASLTHPSR